MADTYKIVRFFSGRPNQTIEKGLSLEAAQAHCADPETSSSTAKSPAARRRTKKYGSWFDGYTKE